MPLTADCLTRLQLTQEPFAPAADEAFLYTDTLLDSVQALALAALAQPNTIVFFTGGGGSGRSVQLMHLLSSLPATFSLIAFRGRRNTTFASVDLTIRNHLRSLGLNADEELSLHTLLSAMPQQPVIAIDDAHLLGSDIVRQLLNLRTDVIASGQQQLRLLLVGTAAAAQQYTRVLEPTDVELFKRINMRPFSLEQVQAYLAHRLRVAGCAEPEAWLTPAEVTLLYQRSEGIPLALNMLATEWLTRLCRTLEREANKPLPEPVVLVETVLGAMPPPRSRRRNASADTTPLAWWQRRWILPTLVGMAMSGVVLLLAYNMRQPATNTFDIATIVPARITTATTVPAAPPFDWAGALAEVKATLARWYHAAFPPTPVPATPIMPLPVPDPVETPPVAEVTPPPAPPPAPVVTTPPAAEPSSPAVATPAPTVTAPTPVTPTAAPPVTSPPPAVTPPPAPPVAKPPATVTTARGVDPDVAWLAQQDGSAFAVQLLTVLNRQLLVEYIAQHRLTDVHIIPTRNKRFIAVLGSFPDRTGAATAAAQLPLAVLSQGHWVRRIADIQADARP